MLGAYGSWAATLIPDKPTPFSYRHPQWDNLDTWRQQARQLLQARIAMPDTGGTPQVTVERQFEYDGLHMEELSWQLPYGPRTRALFLKPLNATGPLPAVLALHDHGGNKFFGWQKITRTSDDMHPNLLAHQEQSYESTGWANEVAQRGYAVLVSDAFTFGSRRIRLADVPDAIRNGLDEEGWAENPTNEALEHIEAYNRWAGYHESIVAKSLFSAGTSWPGVWLAEDQRALDVLCARPDVDPSRVGCGGLSGGGLRTVFLAGVDDRVRCAVCSGMMTTWRDYALHKSHTHTWMIYVPGLPTGFDYPEILGLRTPLPTLVQNNNEDPLFTLPEMQRADTILREVYAKADATEQYRCSFYPGPHKFDKTMQGEAFTWFDQWL